MGARINIGDGHGSHIWYDPCVLQVPNFLLSKLTHSLTGVCIVVDLNHRLLLVYLIH